MVQTHGMEMLSVREEIWEREAEIEIEPYELGFLKEEVMNNGTN
ncbi:hypothetical protein [Bacillus toyonensis]|nr:hypothetical protein [Bacillus toyonensis]